MGSWHTATAEPGLGQAGHLGHGCRQEESGAVDRSPGASPSAPMLSTAVFFTTAFILFVLLYVDCKTLLWGGQ